MAFGGNSESINHRSNKKGGQRTLAVGEHARCAHPHQRPEKVEESKKSSIILAFFDPKDMGMKTINRVQVYLWSMFFSLSGKRSKGDGRSLKSCSTSK